MREIEGGFRIISTSAALDAKEIAGAVEISTTYAGVTLEGVGGAIDIRNKSASGVIGTGSPSGSAHLAVRSGTVRLKYQ